MYRTAKPFFMSVITPLHAGSGQDLGIIDQPIQRERHTGFPKIESSSLKGSIREVFSEIAGEDTEKKKELSLIFGDEKAEHAGALGFTDARLLLFPVKSMKGVFTYITCPQVLKKFKEDMALAKIIFIADVTYSIEQGKCLVANEEHIGFKGNVILEEYGFKIEESDISNLAGKLVEITGIKEITNKLVILPDNDFRDFVNLSTEVITRTKIKTATGTVEGGALFTEEYLPAETVMYSLALASPTFTKEQKSETEVMQYFTKNIPSVIQIGGNATLGKGLVQIIQTEEE